MNESYTKFGSSPHYPQVMQALSDTLGIENIRRHNSTVGIDALLAPTGKTLSAYLAQIRERGLDGLSSEETAFLTREEVGSFRFSTRLVRELCNILTAERTAASAIAASAEQSTKDGLGGIANAAQKPTEPER